MENIDNKPGEEIIKELYASFGLAYYHSECFNRQLCIMYSICTFRNRSDVIRPRLEEKLVYAFSLTMGNIFEEIKSFIPEELHANIKEAIEKRNFLAHYFWYERAHMMFTTKNVTQLINELNDYSELFNNIDEILVHIFEPYLTKFGMTENKRQESMEKIKQGVGPEPLPKKRKYKKKEKIVNAFIIPHYKTLIFQTDDGGLLQPCDVGLVRSSWDKIGDDWIIKKDIQQFLPTFIEPRPQIVEPWNYEFKLNRNKILYFKKGEDSIHWGVKTLKT